MSPALIFAGNSFVGRHLQERLQTTGRPILVTERTPGHSRSRLVCDLTQPSQVETILHDHRPDWIFQCAGATVGGVRADMDRLHVTATRDLLTASARLIPQARIILFGSAAEYGPVDPDQLPVKEDHPPRPTSDFGYSKLSQLRVAEEMAQTHGLRIVVVRPFNILGPGLPEHYFAGRLCRRLHDALARGDRAPIAIANAQATRDWIDVRDVVEAVVRLAQDWTWPAGAVEVFNIATVRETSVLEVAQRFCSLAGLEAVAEGRAESRSEISRSCGDAGKLRRAIGWVPKYTWQESVDAMFSACGVARQ